LSHSERIQLRRKLKSVAKTLKSLRVKDERQKKRLEWAIDEITTLAGYMGPPSSGEGGPTHQVMRKAMMELLQQEYGFQQKSITGSIEQGDRWLPLVALEDAKRVDLIGETSNGEVVVAEYETKEKSINDWLYGDKFQKLSAFSDAWRKVHGKQISTLHLMLAFGPRSDLQNVFERGMFYPRITAEIKNTGEKYGINVRFYRFKGEKVIPLG